MSIETVDIGEARDVPKGLVALALLWVNHRGWSGSVKVGDRLIRTRPEMAAKTVSLIAHDRILNEEMVTRGLPPFFIT